jgi:hypothetical protein
VSGDPDLVGDYGRHKYKVDPERPEDGEFRAFEMASGDGVFLGVRELIVLEGREDPGLVGGCDWCILLHHQNVLRG